MTARRPLPRRGTDLGTVDVIEDGVVSWSNGAIDYVGSVDGYEGEEPERVEGSIVPGFVDSHTHLPFVGWRADEFEARLGGVDYRSLHGEGGIYRSARLFGEASDDEVLEFCRPLIAEMARHGTTTIEMKTGYGLSIASELRQARLARRLAEEAPQLCVVTLLACHAVPHDGLRSDWVVKVTGELIPAAAAEGLADAVDIYVEDIAFSVADLEAGASAAASAGLRLRCHVEQLSNMGAAAAAARLGAATADHLNHLDDDGIATLARSDTIAGLLPASTFVLGSRPPPARALLEAGAAVSIASDLNPGTSPVLSMPEVIAMACAIYRLSPQEALVAATANAACALGVGERVGTLEVGKRADIVLLEAGPVEVPYRPGHNPVRATVAGGTRVY